MSGYPDEKKRHPSYADYNPSWSYLNDRDPSGPMNRRGHMGYGNPAQGHGMGWAGYQGGYYNPHPHMMPVHAHSAPDRFHHHQWNNSKHNRDQLLQNAHSRASPTQKHYNQDVKAAPNKPITQEYNIGLPQEFSKHRPNSHDLLRSPTDLPTHTMRTPTLASHPKPLLGNPLTDLQQLVTNQEINKSPQQETVDLSAHSEASRTQTKPLDGETVPDNNTCEDKPVELVSKVDSKEVVNTSNETDNPSDVLVNNEKTEINKMSIETVKEDEIENTLEKVEQVERELALLEREREKSSLEEENGQVVENIKTPVNNNESQKEKEVEAPNEALGTVSEIEKPAVEIPVVEKEQKPSGEEEKIDNQEDTNDINDDKSSFVKENNETISNIKEENLTTVSSTSDKPLTRKTKRKRAATRPTRRLSNESTSPESVNKKKKKVLVKTIPKDLVVQKKKEVSEGLKKGPVVRIIGPRDNPLSVTIVNIPTAAEEETENSKKLVTPAARKKYHHGDSEYRARAKARHGLFSSTLSLRYDAHSTDHTWICVFCKKGPHYRTTGDLFGPYIITEEQHDDTLCDFSGDEKDITDAQKRGGRSKRSLRASNMVEHFQKMSKKFKRAQSTDTSIYNHGMTVTSTKCDDVVKYEVWVHEICCVWAAGVHLIGTKLVGLQEAIWASVKTMCVGCGEMGANLGCVRRNCANRSHYTCAKDSGWLLNDNTFIAICQVHRLRS